MCSWYYKACLDVGPILGLVCLVCVVLENPKLEAKVVDRNGVLAGKILEYTFEQERERERERES